MFNAVPRFPRRLCALSLAAALAITPAAATGPHPDQSSQVPEASSVQTDTLIMADSVPASNDYTKQGQYLRYSPKLQAKGYSQAEIDLIFSQVPANRIMALLRYDYSPIIAQYAAQPHFRTSSLERYIRYGQQNSDLTAEQVVTLVNVGLDRNFYSNLRLARDAGEHDVLVNKYNYLSTSFVPELTRMASRYASYTAYMEPTAYEWFTKMADDAQKDGIWLYCVSAYRSYSYQRTLYQRYVKQSGQERADTFSARPGYSEHQTGLAVDINTASTSAHFENTKQYRWLTEHCWEYGFILRYPEGKEHITGFQFEPWHYRYVGQELAQAVHESSLTYDEYVASLPAADLPQVQSVALGVQEIALHRAAVTLNGTHYLTAEDLANVLGMSLQITSDGQAILSAPGFYLATTRDNTTAQLNGGEITLAHAPIVQGGDLLLPLEDLVPLLGLEISQDGSVLKLSKPVSPEENTPVVQDAVPTM